MAGVFTVDLSVVNIIGSPIHGHINGVSTYFVDTQPGQPLSGIVNYNNILNSLSLDGGSKVPLANMPSGFHVTSVAIHRIGELASSQYIGYFGQKTIAGGTATAIITLMENLPQTYNPTAVYPSFSQIPQPSNIVPKVIDLYSAFSANISVTGTDEFTFAEIEDNLQYFGNYNIISTQWVLTNLTYPNSSSPIITRPGDRIKLSSSDGSYDFTTLNSINLFPFGFTILSPQFLVWTPLEIEFILPPPIPPGQTVITVQGTQFSGSAFFANIQVIIANPSGIYTIIPGKTDDTLYLNSSSNGNTTVETKIPDPFIKTGFIGA